MTHGSGKIGESLKTGKMPRGRAMYGYNNNKMMTKTLIIKKGMSIYCPNRVIIINTIPRQHGNPNFVTLTVEVAMPYSKGHVRPQQ